VSGSRYTGSVSAITAAGARLLHHRFPPPTPRRDQGVTLLEVEDGTVTDSFTGGGDRDLEVGER